MLTDMPAFLPAMERNRPLQHLLADPAGPVQGALPLLPKKTPKNTSTNRSRGLPVIGFFYSSFIETCLFSDAGGGCRGVEAMLLLPFYTFNPDMPLLQWP